MQGTHEETRSGLDAIAAVTQLLQRLRVEHPTAGVYQAAELQFWWSSPKGTDELDQLFWFDDRNEPVAAAIVVDFTGGPSILYDTVTFCPLFLSDPSSELVDHVIRRGLEHANELGFASVELEVEQDDVTVRSVLARIGIEAKETDVLSEGWLDASARPPVSPLHDGYRLTDRATTGGTHHMSVRNPDFDEARLRQLSLYRPDLDLVILDGDDEWAASCIVWHDPVTATGVVEPMRTSDEHQRRGLARHLLTSGIDRLASAGADRISIGWEPANPASGSLYQSVGFEAVKRTDLFGGPTDLLIGSLEITA